MEATYIYQNYSPPTVCTETWTYNLLVISRTSRVLPSVSQVVTCPLLYKIISIYIYIYILKVMRFYKIYIFHIIYKIFHCILCYVDRHSIIVMMTKKYWLKFSYIYLWVWIMTSQGNNNINATSPANFLWSEIMNTSN